MPLKPVKCYKQLMWIMLSKTKYCNGLVLNQEGTKNIKMTLEQSTENDFQPTTGGHKFIRKILLKGARNHGK